MSFRDRLLATVRAARPVLEEPGVLVVGSEVPNLLEPGAAATLVVSQALDVGVPISGHSAVKRRLRELRERDLLVACGLLQASGPEDLAEFEAGYRRLRSELRHGVRSSLTVLSLLAPRAGMPDPRPLRGRIAELLRRLEAGEKDLP